MANKSKLNELVQKQNLQLPEYKTSPQGDGFVCKLKLGEEVFVSEKTHSRKKAAEDDAAAVAVVHLTTKNNIVARSITSTSTDSSHIKKQEQLPAPQPEGGWRSRSVATDFTKKIEITKEIPLNMFYPSSQQTGQKPSEELQDFCSSRGWTEPIYHLKVKSKESTCGVFVNKVLYSFNETYSSDEEAKQEAAKRVLAKLSSQPADQLENARKGITVIIPASKRSHPATAKLVEPAKNVPVSSVKPTSVASAEEITSAMSKLTTGTDAQPNDKESTRVKQPTVSSSGTQTKKSTDDRNTTDTKPTPTSSSKTDVKPSDDKNTADHKHTGGDKNVLQQLCQKRSMIAEYKTEYPPDAVGYIAKVTVDGKTFTSEVHTSKRTAEAAAAREAIKYLTENSSESTTTNCTMPKQPGMWICTGEHCNVLYFHQIWPCLTRTYSRSTVRRRRYPCHPSGLWPVLR